MIHRLTILIPKVSDELFDRIAGQCPDSLSGVNEDRAYVDFSRESDSLGSAIDSAIADFAQAIDALGDEAIDSLAELAERTLPETPSVGREFIVQNRVRDVDHRGAGDGSTGEADDRCFGIVGQHDVERTLSMSADKARE